jgi:pyridinium-3,5-bisthiocarboxylic acid mononucleotide nickel chelatase
VVETNVDDTTGEILGRAIERITNEGAYDVCVVGYTGKKGRIGQTVRVVCSTDSIEKFAQILVEETGTLGVKVTEYTRLMVPRREISVPVTIEDFHDNVTVKVAEGRIKPDSTQVRNISESQKMPLRDVIDLVTVAARRYLLKESKDSQSGIQTTDNPDEQGLVS